MINGDPIVRKEM